MATSIQLIDDIFKYICSFIEDKKVLARLRLLSHHHKNLIKILRWDKLISLFDEMG